MVQDLFFYFLAFGLISSTIFVITSSSPVHSVLFLILSFFNAAGLFLLTGAEYLAMSLIIIYVGAVAVLFLFVVMMLDIKITRLREGFVKYIIFAFVLAVIACIDLYIAISKSAPAKAFSPKEFMDQDITNTHKLGLLIYTDYVYLFQISGIVLLVAMIGSIVLTHRVRKGVKKQNASKQLQRSRSESVELVNVKIGKGIDI